MAGKNYSTEERQNIVKKIDSLRAQGMDRLSAIKQGGVSVCSYNTWRKKIPQEPDIIIHQEEEKRTYKKKQPTPSQSSKCVVIVTDTQSLSQVLRGLA